MFCILQLISPSLCLLSASCSVFRWKVEWTRLYSWEGNSAENPTSRKWSRLTRALCTQVWCHAMRFRLAPNGSSKPMNWQRGIREASRVSGVVLVMAFQHAQLLCHFFQNQMILQMVFTRNIVTIRRSLLTLPREFWRLLGHLKH